MFGLLSSSRPPRYPQTSRELGFVYVDDSEPRKIHARESVTGDTQMLNPGWLDLPVRKRRGLLDFLSLGASVDDLYDPRSAHPLRSPRNISGVYAHL